MGEAKRRKRLDSNYGEKPYRIEFIDYQRWITDFSPEDREDLIDSPKDLDTIKREFQDKTFWAGYLKLENNNYSFISLISEDNDNYGFRDLINDDDNNGKILYVDLRIIKDIDNKKHLKIIKRNKQKIYEEISRIILPKYLIYQNQISVP